MSPENNHDKNTQEKCIPRILIAGGSSSSGKTTVTIGLLKNLVKAGYKVQPFKVGLDYIDPSYYSEITGRKTRNIDGFLMNEERIRDVFLHGCETDGMADIAVIEGVRGLYEGLESLSDIGSTAQIAKILNCSVILVLNVRSITRSAAAIVSGFKSFDPDIKIAGIILNNIGSRRHASKAKEAIEYYTKVPIIGIIQRNDEMMISMRHLGLIPAIEERRKNPNFMNRIDLISNIIDENVDIEKIIDISKTAPPIKVPNKTIFKNKEKKDVTIGIALDEAFNFYYNDNLELLKLNGADLKFFSPLHDLKLPKVNGIYIGGGYPELFASQLEENTSMREDIKMACEENLPIYGECGGLMYLTNRLTINTLNNKNNFISNIENSTYEMVGALPGKAFIGNKRVVSYNIGTFIKNTSIGKLHNNFIGHEFHHSEIIDLPNNAKFAIKLSRGVGINNGYDGLINNNTIGCYAHLLGSSYLDFSSNFINYLLKN